MAITRPSRVPKLLTWLYPRWYVWDKKEIKKTVYLTFDDGPIPEVTAFVLNTLSRKRNNPIPATFFCIGDNVRKHPDIFKAILSHGHAIGNHTYNHLQGWKTDNKDYLKNVTHAALEMKKHMEDLSITNSLSLFRPPYGKIKRHQARMLRKLGYQIIMYRVIAYDWEQSITPQQCLENVINNVKNGDIIVFHDSVKAYHNLKYTLPKAIVALEEAGFSFGKL